MFNTEEITQAKADFNIKRYCVIDNILEQHYYKAVNNAVPQLPYTLRALAGDKQAEFAVGYKDTEDYETTLKEYSDYVQGRFSYFHHVFVNSKGNLHNENDLVTEFNHVVTEDYSMAKPTPTFHDFVSEITGFPNSVVVNPSYGYYDNESWLSQHFDIRRWCAFIFYFNKTWRADWGGQLCIMGDDNRSIKDSIVPYGNRLVIMDTHKVDVNSHFVSPVSRTAMQPRYSLSGWFYKKDKEGPGPERRTNV